MLKVTIELWPFGDDTRRVVIAEAEIWNDGTGTPELGNYKGVFHNADPKYRQLQVKDHERGLGAWTLLGKFLELMRAKRPPNIQGTAGDSGDSER